MTEIATFDPTRGSMAAITGGHLVEFQEWAKTIAVGSVIPDALRGKPADVFITVMHGLDLGLRPMQALNLVYVVKGRPSLSAEGMRSLILDAGHELEVEADDKKATVRAKRKGTDRWVEATFTIEQAKKAKLGGANWDSYPEDMLVARATTRLAKRYFGDVTNGLASMEELLDAPDAAPRPTLAQAAAARTGSVDTTTGVVEGEVVVDDAAEAERLRQEVMALNNPTGAADEEPLDETTIPAEDGSWPEVAKPGSKAGVA
jgi:hypothetical protein